jgi:hypothetical protein
VPETGSEEGQMRRFQVMMVAALAVAAMSAPALADTQQMPGGTRPVPHRDATVVARQAKCGGEELQCGAPLVKVCNPRNGKCCCATAGTYH